jgi:transposase
MKKYITFVGLNAHKNSIEVAMADEGPNSEVRLYGSIGGDLDSLDKMIRKLHSVRRDVGKATHGNADGGTNQPVD